MELKELLRKRYAAKKFDTAKKVPEDKLKAILEATNLSASSYGLQPFKMIVVSNENLIKKLAEASYGQKNVAEASHIIVFAAETKTDETFFDNFINLTAKTRNIPVETLSDFKKMLINSFSEKTEKEIFEWASKQIYLALGTFLIACANEGIDSCPIGGFIPEEYDKILNLEKYNLKSTVVAVIGTAHPEDKYRKLKKVRKPLNEMIINIE